MNELPIDALVNKENLLPSDYYPKDLVITDQNENNFHGYQDPRLKPMIRRDIYPFAQKMIEDAKEEGIEFIIDSGYRSYDYQQKVLDKLIEEVGDAAFQKAALPGASEHQTGLAFDIAYYRDGVFDDDVKEEDKEAIWLANNSYKYGFILRYPTDKKDITMINYEPWHYRYVGIENATYIKEHDLCLEEYIEYLNNL